MDACRPSNCQRVNTNNKFHKATHVLLWARPVGSIKIVVDEGILRETRQRPCGLQDISGWQQREVIQAVLRNKEHTRQQGKIVQWSAEMEQLSDSLYYQEHCVFLIRRRHSYAWRFHMLRWFVHFSTPSAWNVNRLPSYTAWIFYWRTKQWAGSCAYIKKAGLFFLYCCKSFWFLQRWSPEPGSLSLPRV